MSADIIPFPSFQEGKPSIDSEEEMAAWMIEAQAGRLRPREAAELGRLVWQAMLRRSKFPTRGLAHRYALLRAVGTDGETREEIMQESVEFAERMIECGTLTDGSLRDMVEGKRERLLRQLEDIDSV